MAHKRKAPVRAERMRFRRRRRGCFGIIATKARNTAWPFVVLTMPVDDYFVGLVHYVWIAFDTAIRWDDGMYDNRHTWRSWSLYLV